MLSFVHNLKTAELMGLHHSGTARNTGSSKKTGDIQIQVLLT